MAQVTCSFCGRDKKDVDLMISGIHAHICDKCIIQAQQILNEEVKTKADAGDTPEFKLIKPIDMKRHLDDYIIGQDEAKNISQLLFTITSRDSVKIPLTTIL